MKARKTRAEQRDIRARAAIRKVATLFAGDPRHALLHVVRVAQDMYCEENGLDEVSVGPSELVDR